MSAFDEIRKKRFLFLNLLYEKCGGSKSKMINGYEIGKELNLAKNEVDDIIMYLNNEGLTENWAMDGGIMISHSGIKEVENALSHPSQPTYYFPPVNIINVHNMIGSQIQQGTTSSKQSGSFIINDTALIEDFIKQLKIQLDDLNLNRDDKAEIISDIGTIENQMVSSRPKQGILKESMLSIQRILEGASGNILAQQLLQHVPTILVGLEKSV
jgi:hypothetical protein